MKIAVKRSSKGSSTKSLSKASLTRISKRAVKAVDDFVKSKRPPSEEKDMVALIRELYKTTYHETESFEEQNIGADLAYLVGAIVNDCVCIWPPNEPLVQVLKKRFPKEHRLWKHLVIEE